MKGFLKTAAVGIAALAGLGASSASADECAVNSQSFTFADILKPGGISGFFIENGTTDCEQIVITDRVLNTPETLQVFEQGGAELSDRIVMSNAAGAWTICLLSFNDSNDRADTCDPAGQVTTQTLAGDPKVELLQTSPIFDLISGVLTQLTWISADNGPVSDTFRLEAVPEPITVSLLGMGALGLAAARRRRS